MVSPYISVLVFDPSKIDENGCLGAPNMIIEIQSFSTAKYDLTTKFHLYESSGVKEYWVVYPFEKGFEVFCCSLTVNMMKEQNTKRKKFLFILLKVWKLILTIFFYTKPAIKKQRELYPVQEFVFSIDVCFV